MTDVIVKIPAATKAMVPQRPVMVPVAYNATRAATTNKRMMRSADPIFFFISEQFFNDHGDTENQ